MPVLDWLLTQNTDALFTPQWADLRRLVYPPQALADRLHRAVEFFPCDLLFVHRDAERSTRTARVAEIRAVLQPNPPAICVVPVRMQEAWLLFDEANLREAAGKPSGRNPLGLPTMNRVERTPNPKNILHQALIDASGFRGRKRRHFPIRERVHRLASLITDFSPLRLLPAFRALEAELRDTLHARGWA